MKYKIDKSSGKLNYQLFGDQLRNQLLKQLEYQLHNQLLYERYGQLMDQLWGQLHHQLNSVISNEI